MISSGEELDAFLVRHAPAYDRVIYIGDGTNDFCPVLRLRRFGFSPTLLETVAFMLLLPLSQDIVLCRSFRGLEKRIAREGEKLGLRCEVQYWTGGWEVEEMFNNL
jgi:pyridoxal phosphate phosphatase PHOSPHO2